MGKEAVVKEDYKRVGQISLRKLTGRSWILADPTPLLDWSLPAPYPSAKASTLGGRFPHFSPPPLSSPLDQWIQPKISKASMAHPVVAALLAASDSDFANVQLTGVVEVAADLDSAAVALAECECLIVAEGRHPLCAATSGFPSLYRKILPFYWILSQSAKKVGKASPASVLEATVLMAEEEAAARPVPEPKNRDYLQNPFQICCCSVRSSI